MNKKIVIMILLMIFSLSIVMVYATSGNENGERISVKYLKTSDGDTMRAVLAGENIRIRFLGINTPEVSGEDKVEEPYGNEALAYTKKRLDEAKKIEIEYDTVADKEDRFGRKLAWIWVDDELFELELLEQGLAKTYMLKNDYKYAQELKAAERKAKNAKLGVWSENTSVAKPTSIEEKTQTMEKSEELPKEYSERQVDTISFEEEYSTTDDIISFIIAIVILGVIVLIVKKNSKKNSK